MTDSAEALAERLKDLREEAQLTVREAAEMAGMSPSGYARYEQPGRNARGWLRIEIAQKIARALKARGISPDRVMALARPAPGLSEPEATAWAPGGGQNHIGDFLRRLAPAARTPFGYELNRNLPSLAMLRGDVLVVDHGVSPKAGDVVLVTTNDGNAGCLLRRWHPPFLVSQEPTDAIPVIELRDGDQGYAMQGPVVAMFRPSRPIALALPPPAR